MALFCVSCTVWSRAGGRRHQRSSRRSRSTRSVLGSGSRTSAEGDVRHSHCGFHGLREGDLRHGQAALDFTTEPLNVLPLTTARETRGHGGREGNGGLGAQFTEVFTKEHFDRVTAGLHGEAGSGRPQRRSRRSRSTWSARGSGSRTSAEGDVRHSHQGLHGLREGDLRHSQAPLVSGSCRRPS